MRTRLLFAAGLLLALCAPGLAAHLPQAHIEIDAGVDAPEPAMSYPLARQSLTDRIRLVTPDYDQEHPFTALRDMTTGVVASIDQVPDDVVRLFELRGGTPADDGGSGFAPDRWRVPMTLRVRYSAADIDRADDQIGSDLPRLTHALIHPALPEPWHASIESVTPPGSPFIEQLVGEDGALLALILNLRFELIYLDAGVA